MFNNFIIQATLVTMLRS